MKEIRIHGRGGQGSVTAAELLAQAAFKDGKYSQAFPAFGVERRGAPVQAFARIADEKILTRAQVYFPDIIIVQDSTLLEVVDVFSGLKDDGVASQDDARVHRPVDLKRDLIHGDDHGHT